MDSTMTMTSALGTDDKETSKEVEELVLPGLHSKFNKSGLEFLKSSFLRHVHEILEQGIPDGERQVGDALRFSWSDLKCPQLEEKDPVLEIAAGEGMKGSIEIDAFSIDGNWGYAYKKGLFRWTDSGTFHLAFTKLRVNITMSITIEGPDKQLKLTIHSSRERGCGSAGCRNQNEKRRRHDAGHHQRGAAAHPSHVAKTGGIEQKD